MDSYKAWIPTNPAWFCGHILAVFFWACNTRKVSGFWKSSIPDLQDCHWLGVFAKLDSHSCLRLGTTRLLITTVLQSKQTRPSPYLFISWSLSNVLARAAGPGPGVPLAVELEHAWTQNEMHSSGGQRIIRAIYHLSIRNGQGYWDARGGAYPRPVTSRECDILFQPEFRNIIIIHVWKSIQRDALSKPRCRVESKGSWTEKILGRGTSRKK